MEAKIMDVLRRMQPVLDEMQLRELKEVLQMTFTGCRVIQETDLQVVDRSWEVDLEEFLMSKALEGKASKTVKQYRYELVRLLTYINKPVKNIDSGDISGFMRAYKMIRKVANQTLKNVRAVYSSFFGWLRDRDRIRRNPMVLVESIKVEKKIRKPYTDEERERMLRKCSSLRDKALLEFLYSTAVRVSELSEINREDIRYANKELIVYGKGAKERTVYINERTNMYLKEYLEGLEEQEQGTRSAEELFALLSQGDAMAQAELSQKYLRAAAEMAVEMNCEEIFIADLIQEANISLLMALGEEGAARKDENWLLGRIRAGIRNAIEEQTQRKFEDDYLVAKVEKLESAVRELTEGDDDESAKFSIEELAIILDMKVDEIRDILRLTGDDN